MRALPAPNYGMRAFFLGLALSCALLAVLLIPRREGGTAQQRELLWSGERQEWVPGLRSQPLQVASSQGSPLIFSFPPQLSFLQTSRPAQPLRFAATRFAAPARAPTVSFSFPPTWTPQNSASLEPRKAAPEVEYGSVTSGSMGIANVKKNEMVSVGQAMRRATTPAFASVGSAPTSTLALQRAKLRLEVKARSSASSTAKPSVASSTAEPSVASSTAEPSVAEGHGIGSQLKRTVVGEWRQDDGGKFDAKSHEPRVVVPEGQRSGDMFSTSVDGMGIMLVQVPEGCGPGSVLSLKRVSSPAGGTLQWVPVDITQGVKLKREARDESKPLTESLLQIPVVLMAAGKALVSEGSSSERDEAATLSKVKAAELRDCNEKYGAAKCDRLLFEAQEEEAKLKVRLRKEMERNKELEDNNARLSKDTEQMVKTEETKAEEMAKSKVKSEDKEMDDAVAASDLFVGESKHKLDMLKAKKEDKGKLSKTDTFSVTVPKDLQPGQLFYAKIPSESALASVVVPPGSKPGSSIVLKRTELSIKVPDGMKEGQDLDVSIPGQIGLQTIKVPKQLLAGRTLIIHKYLPMADS